MGAHYVFPMYVLNVLLILSPSCFAVCRHHLSPRITIVFSLLSNIPNFSMSHSCIFLISHASRFSLVYFTFSHYVSSTLLFCHKGISVRLLPLDCSWYTSFFFLAGPGPLHEIAMRFRIVQWTVQICLHSYFLTPRIS